MNRKKRKHPVSIIIAETLFLILCVVSVIIFRMVSFSDEAIKVYEYAHPTCMQMFLSSNEPIVHETKEFVHDSVWRKTAHPSAINKKVASISEIDFLKIIQLDLDRDTITVKVRNNLESIESSFVISINDSKLPQVLDSLRRIGLLPSTRQLIYHVIATDETIYQNVITLLDELEISRVNIPFLYNRSVFGKDIKYVEKVFAKMKIIRSNNPVKDSIKQDSLSFNHSPFLCGGFWRSCLAGKTIQKPSIASIFIDYLNPFGKDVLHKERWW